jgi:hypothetical protein
MKKMRLLLTVLMLTLFLLPLISAEIIINQQPEEVYNFGDVISIPVKIMVSIDTLGSLDIDLICRGEEVNYKTGIPPLSSGVPYETNIYVPLTKNEIKELKGTCQIGIYLGEDYVLTNDFRISNLILLKTDFQALEFDPGENIVIEGQATRENNKSIDGFIELSIVEGNNSILSHLETISNGFFLINASLPEDIKAGALLLKLNAYEVDSNEETTNKGFSNQNIKINQVPTSLEIVFDSREVEPGTNLIVKAVLHDQTGEKMPSVSTIIIKNEDDKIMEQTEIATDEFFEFPVLYNEAPSKWKVSAASNELTSNSSFTILEKESIDIEIINKTLIITNTGNVLYDKKALIKIDNEVLNIDIYLEVDKSQTYIITAPDGKYEVEVIVGDNVALEEVMLTGKVIDVKKAPGTIGSLVKYPFIWIFMILILGFVVFIVFKKGSKKTFIGYLSSKTKKGKKDIGKSKLIPLVKGSLVNSKNKAELSLSIKGDKQNVSVIALNIKNLKEIQSKKGNMEGTLQKTVSIAEENKAATYESHNTLFFILAPTKTRTFKNEKIALETAQKIKGILIHHNKMFKQKINFGLSINYGTIVAKQDKDSLKFMSLGTLISIAKKISSIAKEDILLSEKMKDMLGSHVKTTKQEKHGIDVYSIKELRNVEEHKKFIRNFLDRIEKKK